MGVNAPSLISGSCNIPFRTCMELIFASKILEMFNGGELTLPVEFIVLSRYSLYRFRRELLLDDAQNHCSIEILFDEMESRFFTFS
jgi:hypothetical protein